METLKCVLSLYYYKCAWKFVCHAFTQTLLNQSWFVLCKYTLEGILEGTLKVTYDDFY